MTDSKSIKRWIRAAGEMGPPEPLRISVTDLLREADEIHKFIVSNWEEDEDRPGLKSAGLEMTGETAGDVLSLRDAVEEAQKKYISILDEHLEKRRGELTSPTELEAETAVIEQKTCPVMGAPISPDIYVDYEGRRIYFCCLSCVEAFKKDPEKYVEKVDAEIGVMEETPEGGD